MTECRHTNIVVITESGDRLRCRHCHLTLREEELEGGYCPECLAVSGRKRSVFDRIEPENRKVKYRCEDCGAMLDPVGV